MLGERISKLVPFEAYKLAAGCMLVSPFIPLLFMGEEYAEDNPFLYFISHEDKGLIEAVRKGRKEEFKSFSWKGEPPDPYDIKTFESSKLNWTKIEKKPNCFVLDFYKEMIRLRKSLAPLKNPDKKNMDIHTVDNAVIILKRWQKKEAVYCIMNFSDKEIKTDLNMSEGHWKKIMDSADTKWGGAGCSLPENIAKKADVLIPGFAFIVYSNVNI